MTFWGVVIELMIAGSRLISFTFWTTCTSVKQNPMKNRNSIAQNVIF